MPYSCARREIAQASSRSWLGEHCDLARGIYVSTDVDARRSPHWNRAADRSKSAFLIPNTYGSASIHRELGAAGMDWTFLSHGRWGLFATLAIGVAHVRIGGATSDPLRQAYDVSAWIPFGLGGLGGTVRLGQHLALAAELDGVGAFSNVNLQIGDSRTQPFSRPGILGDVSLRALF